MRSTSLTQDPRTQVSLVVLCSKEPDCSYFVLVPCENTALCPGLPDLQEAQTRVWTCDQAVRQAVLFAAKSAAAAGLPYNPGFDIGVELHNIPSLDPVSTQPSSQSRACKSPRLPAKYATGTHPWTDTQALSATLLSPTT